MLEVKKKTANVSAKPWTEMDKILRYPREVAFAVCRLPCSMFQLVFFRFCPLKLPAKTQNCASKGKHSHTHLFRHCNFHCQDHDYHAPFWTRTLEQLPILVAKVGDSWHFNVIVWPARLHLSMERESFWQHILASFGSSSLASLQSICYRKPFWATLYPFQSSATCFCKSYTVEQGFCVAMPACASPSSSPTMQRRSSTVAHLQNAKEHVHKKNMGQSCYSVL